MPAATYPKLLFFCLECDEIGLGLFNSLLIVSEIANNESRAIKSHELGIWTAQREDSLVFTAFLGKLVVYLAKEGHSKECVLVVRRQFAIGVCMWSICQFHPWLETTAKLTWKILGRPWRQASRRNFPIA